jgi:transposase
MVRDLRRRGKLRPLSYALLEDLFTELRACIVHRDAEILASLPGVGRIVLATLLAEAWEALQRRDYAALRSLTGVAPVTKRSGKSLIVIPRQACQQRLSNAMYHWARVAVQRDRTRRAKYAALRARGYSHGRALRSVADRLLNVACAMLKTGTTFNPSLATEKDYVAPNTPASRSAATSATV